MAKDILAYVAPGTELSQLVQLSNDMVTPMDPFPVSRSNLDHRSAGVLLGCRDDTDTGK